MLEIFHENERTSGANSKSHRINSTLRRIGPTRGQAASKDRKHLAQKRKRAWLEAEARRRGVSIIELQGILQREFTAVGKKAQIIVPDWIQRGGYSY